MTDLHDEKTLERVEQLAREAQSHLKMGHFRYKAAAEVLRALAGRAYDAHLKPDGPSVDACHANAAFYRELASDFDALAGAVAVAIAADTARLDDVVITPRSGAYA